MLSQDGATDVILNGEIYNYRELREQLRSKGHSFRTQTDTEVLLAAWAEWGEDCLPRLNGMFAFGLWDESERALFLVRDRVGIKPLYYAESRQDACTLPSTSYSLPKMKSILASGLIKAEPGSREPAPIPDLLWVHLIQHALRESKLFTPPGHFVMPQNNEFNVRQWWDISFDSIEEGRSDAWWQEQFRDARSRHETRDGCGCAAGSVSLWRNRFVVNRGDDEASQQGAANRHVHDWNGSRGSAL